MPHSVTRRLDGWRRWWLRRKSAAEVRLRQERQTARQRIMSLAGRRTKISHTRISSGRSRPAAMRRLHALVVTPAGADSLSWVAPPCSASDVGFLVRRDRDRTEYRHHDGAGRGGLHCNIRIVIGNALPTTSNKSARSYGLGFDGSIVFSDLFEPQGCAVAQIVRLTLRLIRVCAIEVIKKKGFGKDARSWLVAQHKVRGWYVPRRTPPCITDD